MSALPKALSPSLLASPDGGLPAYEFKFRLAERQGLGVLRRMASLLQPDPFCQNGSYHTCSVYFDTPTFDVLYRSPGYERHKYRIRRYGQEQTVHLERKSKREGRVSKRRTQLAEYEQAHLKALWFVEETAKLNLKPVCTLDYSRMAFVGTSETGPIRATFDRAIVASTSQRVFPEPAINGKPLFPDVMILELKFLAALPLVFRELLTEFRLCRTGFSKYRQAAVTLGFDSRGRFVDA